MSAVCSAAEWFTRPPLNHRIFISSDSKILAVGERRVLKIPLGSPVFSGLRRLPGRQAAETLTSGSRRVLHTLRPSRDARHRQPRSLLAPRPFSPFLDSLAFFSTRASSPTNTVPLARRKHFSSVRKPRRNTELERFACKYTRS